MKELRPNPPGKLVMIPEDRIYATGISVRRGLQLLMTTGMAEERTVIELDEEDYTEGNDDAVGS